MRSLTASILVVFALGCASPAAPTPEPQPVAPVTSPQFEIEFSYLTSNPGTAYVMVIKDDPVAGLVPWSEIHKEGDRIGWSRENGVETSIHEVFSKRLNKSVSVDFDTGAVLTSIQVGKHVPYMTQKCPVILWPNPPQCPGPKEESAIRRVDEVHFRNADGSVQTWQKITSFAPDDFLCADHGGKRLKLGWTEEEAREARAPEGFVLLKLADYDWWSRNPKIRSQARDTYRRLMKDFGDIPLVRKHMIRIKERSESEIED